MGDISNEPTMEEILSSIKKIIAEDGDKSLSAPRPRRTLPRDASHDELGNAVSVLAPGPRRDDDVLELTEMAEEEAPAILAHAPVAVPQAPAPEIVSQVTMAASRSALDSLSALIVKPEVSGSDTLEGLVRDMLRPMLKDWLDANLPDVVERVVAKEVARISGR
jgi:uncharacterized protein